MRSGPVDEALTVRVAETLNLQRGDILDAQWVDNGPGWVGVLLRDASAVLALEPNNAGLPIGAIGAYPSAAECAFEVRAFFPMQGSTLEDPVTGSLNASLAQWLIGTGRAAPPYVVSPGARLGRAGRVHISTDADGAVWVGGGTLTCVSGDVNL